MFFLYILIPIIYIYFFKCRRIYPKQPGFFFHHLENTFFFANQPTSPLASEYHFQLENGERTSPGDKLIRRGKRSTSITEWLKHLEPGLRMIKAASAIKNKVNQTTGLYSTKKLQGTVIQHIGSAGGVSPGWNKVDCDDMWWVSAAVCCSCSHGVDFTVFFHIKCVFSEVDCISCFQMQLIIECFDNVQTSVFFAKSGGKINNHL